MKALVKPRPAPTKGWNARDSVASMKDGYALLLDNWFPAFGKCTMRKGYSEYATGLGGSTRTLAEFHAGATRKFVAGANGNIWDISSAGAAASLASGFTENSWQTVVMDGKMGLVNGSDAPQVYDGSTVGAMTVSGSGLTVTSLINVNVFKSRSYFIESNSQSFWYSAVNTLGGALTEFNLSRVTTLGGNLAAMGTWTRDGGDGMDDLAVFIMTSGEVIIYQGSDPGSSFSLIGIFRVGPPVGYRCFVKAGPDLVVITKDGFIPLSKALGAVDKTYAISDNIRGAAIDAAQKYSANTGWQGIIYPRGGYALFNIPLVVDGTYHQYVVNTATGAWCRFKGMASRSWGLYNDRLYFGGDGTVYLADDGFDDNGSDIEVDGQDAYSYFQTPNRQKLFTAVQPVLASEGDLVVSTALAVDFADPSTQFTSSPSSTDGAQWDVGVWSVDFWAGGSNISKSWLSASGMGYSGSLRLRIRAQGQSVSWFSTNYMYQAGGYV
jgi:hypothetical protein